MTVSYNLASNPIWYMADTTGKPLGAGYIVFLSSLNPTLQKLVYEDAAGLLPWPTQTVPRIGAQGVLVDENGTSGPFYFQFDSSAPTDLYDIYFYDSNGVQVGDPILDFTPGTGSGGTITEAFILDNLISNNIMYRNVGNLAGPIGTFQKLAPSNHAGFAATSSNAGPDIIFAKNNTSATDAINFTNFTLGATDFTPDITPPFFFNYVCTGAGAAETSKYVQYPINAQVQNLSNQSINGYIWARCNSGNNQIVIQTRQFFGDSGASSDVVTVLQTLTLTSSWAKYTFSGTIPTVGGKTVGACGNDATFLQVQLPFNATTNIDFTKPTLYLGSLTPQQDFAEYDAFQAVFDSPRTGDIRTSMNRHYFWGWVPMNDGTIGSASSNASNRQNIDTFPLFNEIWNKMKTVGEQYAPILNSDGTLGSYGADAVSDFAANKQLALTKGLGQVFAGTTALVPAAQTYTVNTGVSTSNLVLSAAYPPGTNNFPTGTPVILTNSGGAAPSGLTVGQVYYSIVVNATTVKLATTLANALAGTPVTFSDNGSGTNQVQVFADVLGSFYGERQAVGSHTHSTIHAALFEPRAVVSTAAGGSILGNIVSPSGQTSAGQSQWSVGPNDNAQTYNLQPTTFLNVFLKL